MRLMVRSGDQVFEALKTTGVGVNLQVDSASDTEPLHKDRTGYFSYLRTVATPPRFSTFQAAQPLGESTLLIKQNSWHTNRSIKGHFVYV